jgi:acetylornithine deacetylase
VISDKVKQDVLAAVDGLKDELIKLTVDTVKIPSVNPTYSGIVREEVIGGETRVNEYLKPVMETIGLKTDMWEEEEGRANLVGVYKGTGRGKSLIFNGHVDVVPPGAKEEWTVAGAWSGKIADGKIWGRGTTDMKGGNAAAIIALKALLNAGYEPKGDVIIEDVVGEEMMNTDAGTGAVIKRGYKADAAIVVEPSAPPYRLGLIPVGPGLFHMVCTIKGKATHECMRDELVRAGGLGAKVGVHSIDKALIIYEGLRKLEEEWGQTKSHPLFTRPGHFTIHPGVITGGPRGAFVISEESTIEYAILHAPQDSEEQVKKEVEDQIARFAQTDPWLKENPPKVEWLFWWPPFDVPVDAPICKTIAAVYEAVMGEPIKYYGFAAVDDAAFLNRAGIPAVTFGPGNIFVAHAPNECVEISELVDAAKLYAVSIVEWCGV